MTTGRVSRQGRVAKMPQTEQITTALLVFGPLYSSWVEQQLPIEYQGVRNRLLVMLLQAPQRPMRYYARLLGISKAHMTTLVDECTRSGSVVRMTDVHDRRASQLALSATGRVQAQHIWANYVAQTEQILADIPQAQRDVFLAVSVQLAERMHALGCGSGFPFCDNSGDSHSET